MSNLTKLDFAALDITGNNYLPWKLDVELWLEAKSLGETIKKDNTASEPDRAKALIFLLHHIDEGLKNEYLTIKDPFTLWSKLCERYGHQKMVVLPKARFEWGNLRFQDFKSISEYNSNLFRITSQLKMCGQNVTDDELLEKTLSTFNSTNLVLQELYRERRFQKYSDLITCLLVVEQNNQLLLKNHESRPTGSAALPEACATTSAFVPEVHAAFSGPRNGRGRGRGRGHGRGRGGRIYREPNRYAPYRQQRNVDAPNDRQQRHGFTPYDRQQRHDFTPNDRQQRQYNNRGRGRGSSQNERPRKKYNDICYKCGSKGHWSRICQTDEHLVQLYQDSQRKQKNVAEANLIENIPLNTPQLQVSVNSPELQISDFFVDSSDTFGLPPPDPFANTYPENFYEMLGEKS